MSNLKKKFQEILDDLDKNIKNKEDLDYIKSSVYNIALLFLDEIDKISELNLDRMGIMLEREKELGYKISRMEKIINNIEKEVFAQPEGDIEIICPYCNAEFTEEVDLEFEHEIKCPECGNIIELDWNDDECSHHCGDGENCHCHDYEEDEDNEEDDDEFDSNEDEDDM